MTKELPQWVKNKYARDIEYAKNNIRQVSIKLNKNTDAELIETYESIKDKAQWFKDCLRQYAKDHLKE